MPNDIKEAFITVHKLVCKVITVYHDGSQKGQNHYRNRELGTARCPECGGQLEHDGGCVLCRSCGYSKCG